MFIGRKAEEWAALVRYSFARDEVGPVDGTIVISREDPSSWWVEEPEGLDERPLAALAVYVSAKAFYDKEKKWPEKASKYS